KLSEVRRDQTLAYLRPDGKSQVTVRYEVDEHGRQKPAEIERVLISTQHREGLDMGELKRDLIEHVIGPVLAARPDLCEERKLAEPAFVSGDPTPHFDTR